MASLYCIRVCIRVKVAMPIAMPQHLSSLANNHKNYFYTVEITISTSITDYCYCNEKQKEQSQCALQTTKDIVPSRNLKGNIYWPPGNARIESLEIKLLEQLQQLGVYYHPSRNPDLETLITTWYTKWNEEQQQQQQSQEQGNDPSHQNRKNLQTIVETVSSNAECVHSHVQTAVTEEQQQQSQEQGNNPSNQNQEDMKMVVETVTSNPECGQGCVTKTAVETATSSTVSINDPDSELRRQVWHSIRHNSQRRCTILFM